MKHAWVNDINIFKTLSGEWDEALINSGSFNPFLLSEFIISWWKHFGNSFKLNIFILYKNKKIVGGIPLYIKKGGLRDAFVRILLYIGGSAANYTEPFFMPGEEFFFDFLKNALERRSDWDVLYLPDIRRQCCLLPYLFSADKDNRFFYLLTQDHFNWSIDLSMGKEQYFASLAKKMMRDLRAKRKHAIKNYGESRLINMCGEENIKKYFQMYCDFSTQAFQNRSRVSTFENKNYASFLSDFLISMDRRDRLDCQVLFFGETVLAISFAYKFGKGFNWVLTAFNFECRYVRPGYLLIEELISELFKRKETYYNWYGYERFYKEQWCNRKEPLYKLFLIRRSFAGVRYGILRKVESAIRSNPLLLKTIRKISHHYIC